jgi:hypothetical protein
VSPLQLNICSEVVLLGFRVFWGFFILFSIVVVVIYIPTSVYKCSFFPLHLCQHLLLFVFYFLIFNIFCWY